MRELAESVGLDIRDLTHMPKVIDVKPVGRCYGATKSKTGGAGLGRMQYASESDAKQALRHIQWKRIFDCAESIERRFYLHETEHGGCGFYHLSKHALKEVTEDGQED